MEPMIFSNKQGHWERTQVGEHLTITIELENLRGQGRPRFSKWGAYEDKRDKEQKRIIARAWQTVYGGIRHPQANEVEVDVIAHRKLPKSASKYRQYEADVVKPDLDNICKSVLDALTGVAWSTDDCAVTRINAHKDRRVFRATDLLTINVRYYTNVFIRP